MPMDRSRGAPIDTSRASVDSCPLSKSAAPRLTRSAPGRISRSALVIPLRVATRGRSDDEMPPQLCSGLLPMTDSTAIAIVSVSVSGLTALASPVIAARMEGSRDGRRAARERNNLDLDELRTLLDQAAVSAEAARIGSQRLSRLCQGLDSGGQEAMLVVRSELIEGAQASGMCIRKRTR